MCKKSLFTVWGMLTVLFFSSTSVSQPLFQVTNEPAGVSRFVWSPDGTQLAFTASENGDVKLYRVDLDGSNKTFLRERVNLSYSGSIDWKGDVIVFKSWVAGKTGLYDMLWKRIAPDGSNEATIVGPYWYSESILSADGNWLLFRDAPNGWWRANRSDLNGSNRKTVSHAVLVQGIAWLGENQILYTRGPNFNTPCGLHKVNFDGGKHVQLTPENLPNSTHFSASPDASKILYCDATSSNWNIWIMDPDGSHKTQLTTDAAHDYLSSRLQRIWSPDSRSFYFVSNRSGNGDIYRLNIDGTGSSRITRSDSSDHTPTLSADGMKLAFISNRNGVNNIWVHDLRVMVAIPDTSVENVRQIDIPVEISNLMDREIYSFSLTLKTGADILQPKDVVSENTLTQDWGKSARNIENGNIKIAMAGATPITKSGTLLFLRCQIPESVVCSGTTSVAITDMLLNEGQHPLTTRDGSFAVSYHFDISGNIAYYSSHFAVPDVDVSLDGHSTVTGNSGDYLFDAIDCGDYTLRPDKPDSAVQAINPFDAALILMAKVGLVSLTPYQMVAADVTGNGSVTAFDASYILRYFVGNISHFPVGKYWTFIPAGFPIDQNNWSTAPDSIRYAPLEASQFDQDFYAIVYGDVSGDWAGQATAFKPKLAKGESRPQIILQALRKEQGGIDVLPISVSYAQDIVSLGFSCEYQPEQLRFLGANVTSQASPLFAAHARDGRIKLGLASTQPMNESGPLIELRFNQVAAQVGNGIDVFRVAEFSINGDFYTDYTTEAVTNPAANLPETFELLGNYPNPFNPQTTISFGLPHAAEVTIRIYNLKGELMTELFNGSRQAGYYSVIWDASGNSSGTYFIEMQAADFVQTKKCALLK